MLIVEAVPEGGIRRRQSQPRFLANREIREIFVDVEGRVGNGGLVWVVGSEASGVEEK